jgi:hypothetical protein
MFKSAWSRNAVAVLGAILMSATCLTAALGPAQPNAPALAAQVLA